MVKIMKLFFLTEELQIEMFFLFISLLVFIESLLLLCWSFINILLNYYKSLISESLWKEFEVFKEDF